MPGHVKSHRGFVEGLKTEGTGKECTASPELCLRIETVLLEECPTIAGNWAVVQI